MSYLWDNKHFIITHFPIVLLLFSFLFDVAAMIWKKQDWHTAALICLIAGTLGTIAAVLTGPETRMPNSGVETHEQYGKITMIVAIVLSVARVGIMIWKKRDVGRNPVVLLVSLAAVVLVMYTAHLGGKMVHRPMGNFPQGQMGGGPGGGQNGGPGPFAPGGGNGGGQQPNGQGQRGAGGQQQPNGQSQGSGPAQSPKANP